MTNKNDNKNDSADKPMPEGPVVGIPTHQFLDYLCHIAKGNLVALVRLTAVCEHLRTTAEGLPEDSPAREAIRKAVGGLSLPGLILAKQGKDLSDHEDGIIAALKAEGQHSFESCQAEALAKVFTDHAAAGKEWLSTESAFKNYERGDEHKGDNGSPPEPGKKRDRSGSGNWSADGRLN